MSLYLPARLRHVLKCRDVTGRFIALISSVQFINMTRRRRRDDDKNQVTWRQQSAWRLRNIVLCCFCCYLPNNWPQIERLCNAAIILMQPPIVFLSSCVNSLTVILRDWGLGLIRDRLQRIRWRESTVENIINSSDVFNPVGEILDLCVCAHIHNMLISCL